MSGRDGETPKAQGREARLKAALKANIARRKAQARAREGADDDDADGGQAPETGRKD
ncbi:hypothetical protein [Wenxinia marina]|uniref:Uncharacterized protein n=1 Tax=Wenxinia marina DSM 24838 TaxID=1123501 RepID=A0A0D0PFG5_9RHOB|nr:hypothetical protein [Wenxinia marina]KIQ70091.1 hypothetical protein Wenmar_01662 [Wenxinia marina DSM 24838]GGL63422.1 hypothetical protein GCM10011392_17620 [Wenxinia marina]